MVLQVVNGKVGFGLLLICIVVSSFVGALTAAAVIGFAPKSDAVLYGDFYDTEALVSVSPFDFVSDYNRGKIDGLVVDLRASRDYASGHLVTAVNIPAVEMSAQEVVTAFAKLPVDKPIITYCYSSYCTLARKVGKTLADNGIFVKHFTAGWYEIERDLNEFTTTGKGAQISGSSNGLTCPVNSTGDFSC